MTELSPTHETALALTQAGYSVVPVALDGTKRPAVSWKPYTQAPATIDQINNWYQQNPDLGVGIITGKVSGNIELLELEADAMPHLSTLAEIAEQAGISELWHRANTGWTELSPSGGYHIYLHLTDHDVPGNTKIASTANHETLAETRGENGFVVTAPTAGKAHPTGKPWTHLTGNHTTPAKITWKERETLHTLIRALLHQEPHTQNTTHPNTGAGTNHAGLAELWKNYKPSQGDTTPGDDYENQTSWDDILTPHGWTRLHTHAHTTYWRRPGKRDGISATTGNANDRDRLYVFTTSTSFDTETPYTKFAAYTHLNHNGDYTQAAKQLAQDGYGKRAERVIPATNITPLKTNTPKTATTPTSTDTTTPATVTHISNAAPKLNAYTITDNPDQLTDAGNATHITTRYKNTLRYIPDAGRWAHWDGTRWEWSPDNAPALQAALETITSMPTDNEQIRKHRHKSLSARSLSNALQIVKTHPTIRANADTFDTHTHELNTPQGIVNLNTGQLQPHNPDHGHTMITKASPKPGAPRWETFINWITCNRPTLARYIQQLYGLTLLGQVTSHILPFFYGSGANGKSVLMETMREILGDYAIEADAKLLTTGPQQHPTELAQLRGKRNVTLSEVNETDRFDEAKLKHLTGGDAISARYMRMDYFDFEPSHLFILAGNHKPAVHSGGDSFWRRVRLIPFDNKITDKDRNENLKNELLQEADGILHWAIQGTLDYLQNGLQEPQEVTQATHEYSTEEDHLGRFADLRLNIGGGDYAREQKRDLRAAYVEWCRAEDEKEMNTTAFGRELKQRFGLGTKRSNGRDYYTNVTLFADENETESIWK